MAKYSMAISKHQHEEKQRMFEAFKQFTNIYHSKVELTGEKLRRVDPFALPMDPTQPITYTETNEVSIKMPQDEYEKFMKNWAEYIDLMYVAKDHPLIQDEYLKLQVMVQLLK